MHRKSVRVNSLYSYLYQLAKTLVPSYYCLYSLFNKIRDKGKTVSAGYGGGQVWEGVEEAGRNDPNIVCKYELKKIVVELLR
jgi:hypothetical protein